MDTLLANPSNLTLLKPSFQIRKCEDLILETFIRITLDGDHTRLGGEDTAVAWDAIRVEFEALSGGIGYSASIMLLREINFLASKLQVIDELTKFMEKYYLPEMGQMLAEYGINYEWENISEEQYLKQLNMVISRSKTWYVELKAKEKEWRSKNPDTGVDEVKLKGREYFEDWLIALSKDQGHNLNPMEITAYRFAIMIKKASQAAAARK